MTLIFTKWPNLLNILKSFAYLLSLYNYIEIKAIFKHIAYKRIVRLR